MGVSSAGSTSLAPQAAQTAATGDSTASPGALQGRDVRTAPGGPPRSPSESAAHAPRTTVALGDRHVTASNPDSDNAAEKAPETETKDELSARSSKAAEEAKKAMEDQRAGAASKVIRNERLIKIEAKLERADFESSLRNRILCVDEHQCKSVARDGDIAVPGLLFCAAIFAVNESKVAAAHWMPPLDYDSDSDSEEGAKSLAQLKNDLYDHLGDRDDVSFYVFRGKKNTKNEEIKTTLTAAKIKHSSSLEDNNSSFVGNYTISGVNYNKGKFSFYGTH